MKDFAQNKCESKSKSFSVMSLAGIQVSSTIPYTSPLRYWARTWPASIVKFAGSTEQKAAWGLHVHSLLHVYSVTRMLPRDLFCTGLFSEENPN